MAGDSRRRLAFRPALAGRVLSAFHPMRVAAAESPGLPLCADDRKWDRQVHWRKKPELLRSEGTRLPWRMAPGVVPDIGPGLAPGSPPKSAAMSGEVRRGLAPRLPPVPPLYRMQSLARLALKQSQLPPIRFLPDQLAAQDGTSSRAHQKAGAVRDSAESGACAACDSVRGERPPRRARNQSSIQRSVPRPQFQGRRC
jgi:hypothetical protein